MKEETIVRENLMNEPNYSPYCGNPISRMVKGGCDNPRTKFNGSQFICPHCNWVSEFPTEFIQRYKARWFLQ